MVLVSMMTMTMVMAMVLPLVLLLDAGRYLGNSGDANAESGVYWGLMWPGQSRCGGRQGSQQEVLEIKQQPGWTNCLGRLAMQRKQRRMNYPQRREA